MMWRDTDRKDVYARERLKVCLLRLNFNKKILMAN